MSILGNERDQISIVVDSNYQHLLPWISLLIRMVVYVKNVTFTD